MTAPWTLGAALGAFLARPECAPTTLYNHRKHAAALLRALGDRPVADFAGKKGGRLIASLLQGDLASGAWSGRSAAASVAQDGRKSGVLERRRAPGFVACRTRGVPSTRA